MPETKIVDEEVAVTRPTGRGLAARAVEEDTVSVRGGAGKSVRGGVEDDTHNSARRTERPLPESTEKLLQKMEAEEKANARKPAPHDEGDADEDEVDEDVVDEGDEDEGAGDADGEAGDDTGEADGESDDAGDGDEGAAGDDEEGEEDTGVDEIRETNARLEARNRELIAELESVKKAPKSARTERDVALSDAIDAYYNEGSVASLRKILSIVVGASHDSKEVDAELSGVYTDLTARELGVTLDANQQTLRDNARTRLLLARDKRDKAEAEKKPVADNSADDVNYGEAIKHIEPLLITKAKGTKSIADENPMLMTLAEEIDGCKPAELLARAIRQEILAGTLDPKLDSVTMIKKVAPKIERYYAARAAKIAAAAKNKNPDTAPSGKKPKAANATSTEQRQSPAARTLTNAAVSRAPAKNPKTNPQKAKTTTEKTRKDFPSEEAWQNHLFDKHNFR